MGFGSEQDKLVTSLAEDIAIVLKGQDSTVAIGALISVIAPIILNSPDVAYSVEVCNFIERQAQQWRQLVGDPAGNA